jgi:MraZ protein
VEFWGKMAEDKKDALSLEARVGFCGNYSVRIDSAMRLSIPAKFRDVLEKKFGEEGTRLIIFPGDRCVRVMPYSVWLEFERELAQISRLNPEGERLHTFIYGLMSECELDSQSRIRLTPALCRYADLERDAVVVGRKDEMSIWRQRTWDEFSSEMFTKYTDVMRELDRSRMPRM